MPKWRRQLVKRWNQNGKVVTSLGVYTSTVRPLTTSELMAMTRDDLRKLAKGIVSNASSYTKPNLVAALVEAKAVR